jgi:hypothetical protein
MKQWNSYNYQVKVRCANRFASKRKDGNGSDIYFASKRKSVFSPRFVICEIPNFTCEIKRNEAKNTAGSFDKIYVIIQLDNNTDVIIQPDDNYK